MCDGFLFANPVMCPSIPKHLFRLFIKKKRTRSKIYRMEAPKHLDAAICKWIDQDKSKPSLSTHPRKHYDPLKIKEKFNEQPVKCIANSAP